MSPIARILTLCLLVVPATAQAKLQVVASVPDLAAIASAIGSEHVDVVCLTSPNQDPHYVDPRPSFMVTLNRADLLVVIGLDLESSWLSRLITNSRNPEIQVGSNGYLEVSSVVERLQVPNTPIDRAMGDIHAGGNPHFLLDPRRARSVAQAIAGRLALLAPNHAKDFNAKLEQLDRQLLIVATEARERFQTLTPGQRQVVAYHQSLAYLLDWLGLTQIATVEPRPGIAPSPSHTALVLRTMRSTKTHTLLQESYYQRGPSETLARLANARLYVFPGGADFEGGESYVERLRKLSQGLFEVLGASNAAVSGD